MCVILIENFCRFLIVNTTTPNMGSPEIHLWDLTIKPNEVIVQMIRVPFREADANCLPL
jgi:hypothetical protein